MREIGPVRKGLSGDIETATAQLGIARTQLGILKNQMRLAGLTIGARAVRLADGTVMRVSSYNGQDFVDIETPVLVNVPVDLSQPEVQVPEFDVPVVPPVDLPLALFNAILEPDSSNGYMFRPMYLDDKFLTAADSTPHILYPAGHPAVRYRHSVDGGNSILVGRIDSSLQIPLGLSGQPSVLKVTSANGFKLDQAYIQSPTAVHAAGSQTKPAALGYIQPPDVMLDTTFTIEGDAHGQPQVKGVFLVEKDIQAGSLVPTFRSSQTVGGVTSTKDAVVTINGRNVPFGDNHIYPTQPQLNYTSTFQPFNSGGPVAPLGPTFGIYTMTADPAAQYSVVSPTGATQIIYTPAGNIAARTSTSFVWTQTGGNLPMRKVINSVGIGTLTVVTNITAYGMYTASGTLTFVDAVGNTVEVSVSISINYLQP